MSVLVYQKKQIIALKTKYNWLASACHYAKRSRDQKDEMQKPRDKQWSGPLLMEVTNPWNKYLLFAVNPHPQFGGPLSLFSTCGCEKCSMLRNHKAVARASSYLAHILMGKILQSILTINLHIVHDPIPWSWPSLKMSVQTIMLLLSTAGLHHYPNLWSLGRYYTRVSDCRAASRTGSLVLSSECYLTQITWDPFPSRVLLYKNQVLATNIPDSQYHTLASQLHEYPCHTFHVYQSLSLKCMLTIFVYVYQYWFDLGTKWQSHSSRKEKHIKFTLKYEKEYMFCCLSKNNPTHHLQHQFSPQLCLYATDECKYSNKTKFTWPIESPFFSIIKFCLLRSRNLVFVPPTTYKVFNTLELISSLIFT